MSVLWPALGPEGSESAAPLREFYRHSLSNRHIDSAGYVNMNQHRGLAHPGGWPFPTWHQSGGIGWHFTHAEDPYSIQLKVPLTPLVGMIKMGVKNTRVDPAQGLVFSTKGTETTLSHVYPFRVNTLISPFIAVEWSGIPPDANPRIEFTTEEFPEFDAGRSVAIPLEDARPGLGLVFSMVPMHGHPDWNGHFTGLRLRWENAQSQEVVVRAIHTAVDSRHPITNSLFTMGCADYFRWTGEVDFLKQNIDRIRKVIAYARSEFAFEEHGCVLVPWVGHDGRRGFEPGPTGEKRLNFGHGVGNNYYDLVPFGHRDCYATVLLYAALRDVAELERAIETNPKWGIATPKVVFASAEELGTLARNLKERASALFWNERNGRFYACFDADGVPYDYGFTFLNLEAIHYEFASEEQSRSILTWLDGDRIVAGDTSQGDDIYHWKFAPRATTRRNVEWYGWVWHAPETIPWGGQIQDGGAVLGFSFHDLMSRLRMNGPDDAWRRLQAILDWFEEVEAEGGYRTFYAKPGRGSLQGGGTAGGLGMDHEFFESVLVPQVMLYGFLGFKPTADGANLNPKLPSSWSELTISRVHYLDHIFDLKVSSHELVLRFRHRGKTDPTIHLPEGDEREIRFEEYVSASHAAAHAE
ncbi:MAG: glycosyl hydrolase family 65 protein [Verrucomicrobiota bacterium]